MKTDHFIIESSHFNSCGFRILACVKGHYYHNLIPCRAGKAVSWMNVGNITDIPQLLPRATSGLTFKEVGLQPEFQAYELAVTPPGVAS